MKKRTTLNDLASMLTKQGKEIDKQGKEISKQGKEISKQGKEIRDLTENGRFIVKNMATKEDVREIVREEVKPTDDSVAEVKMKVDGIQRSLDAERLQRTDLKIPRRLHDVEEKLYGAGGSKHPKHISL